MDVRDIPKNANDIRQPVNADDSQIGGIFEGASIGKAIKLTDLIRERFIAAEKFEGQKHGYVFTVGLKGTGYYLEEDIVAAKRHQKTQQDQKKKAMAATTEKTINFNNNTENEIKEDSVLVDVKIGEESEKQNLDIDEIIKKAEEASRDKEIFDVKNVKKLSFQLQRRYKENSELRLKYQSDPEKFMNSEIDLDVAIENLEPLVDHPELYPNFIQTNVIQILVKLMDHENVDIASSTAQFMQKITDSENNEEWVNELKLLVGNLIENEYIDISMIKAMQCKEEDEEEENLIFNILTSLDNLMDIAPLDTSKNIIKNKQFILWLMNRLNGYNMDSLKILAAELLSQLLQIGDSIRNDLLDLGIQDALFHEAKKLHSNFPKNDDGLEFFENIFNGLCCCLLTPEGKEKFIKSSGIDFMLDVVKSYKELRLGAFRVIQFSAIRHKSTCERIVAIGGLQIIFALFMQKLKINDKKDVEAKADMEELVISLIAMILQELPNGAEKDRVASKFVENEFEKTDKLMELYFKYSSMLEKQEVRGNSSDEVDFINRNKSIVQQISIIISYLWMFGDKALRQRLLLFLHQKSHALYNIKIILDDIIQMLEENDHLTRKRINNLILSLTKGMTINSQSKNKEREKRELKEQIALKKRERDERPRKDVERHREKKNSYKKRRDEK